MRKKLVIERSKVKIYGIDTCLVSGAEFFIDLKKVRGSSSWVMDRDLEVQHIVNKGSTEIATLDSIITIDDGFNFTGFTLDKMADSGPLADRKATSQEAVTSLGGKDSPMVTTLADAESMVLRTWYSRSSSNPNVEAGAVIRNGKFSIKWR